MYKAAAICLKTLTKEILLCIQVKSFMKITAERLKNCNKLRLQTLHEKNS